MEDIFLEFWQLSDEYEHSLKSLINDMGCFFSSLLKASYFPIPNYA